MNDLTGKNALVTGGGTGVGFGISRVLLAAGATVTLAARRGEVLAEAAKKLADEGYSERIQTIACDVTDEAQVRSAVAFSANGGNLDVLVNNAGSAVPGVLMQMDAGAWRFCSDINIVGPALCMKHAALLMKEHGGGSIINISSVSATKYQPWLIGYNTTKAGQDMLTRSAAVELAQHKIRVNAVVPGFVPVNEYLAGLEDDYRHITPLGRVGTAEEIGEAVLFFASSQSDWVTGQCLAVDGGLSVPLMLDMSDVAKGLYGEEAFEEFKVNDYRSVPGKGR
jgi:NAD(P)-dependent dehydrogenase (short-subunit alcohol dehydrogenase family)